MRSEDRITRAMLVGLAFAIAAGVVFIWLPTSARAGSGPSISTGLPVDHQLYIVDGPYDPYASDPSNIHVGVTGKTTADGTQREFARSFIHIALEYLPSKALIGSAKVTLHITSPADASKNTVYQTYNVNSDQALMQACVLTAPIPDKIDSTHPAPGYDCEHGSAVGSWNATDKTWTFDLAPLLKTWSLAGNTGAAIVPIASGADSAWTVSFEKGHSSSVVGYTVPPEPSKPGPSPSTSTGSSYYRIPVTVTKPYPFPTTFTAPVAQTPAPAPSQVVQVPAPPQPATRSAAWMWVLPTCLAAAALVMAISHRPGLAGPMPFTLRVITDVRRHPRSYAVASVAMAWGLLFVSYSFVIAPNKTSAGSQAATAVVQGPVLQPGGPSGHPSTTPQGPQTTTTYQTLRSPGTPPPPGSEFNGPGTYRMIGTTRVFFPANGGAPAAQLYEGADDLVGIDYANKRIKLCGHAALTFGPAFNIGTSDLNVYWDYLNSHGGIDGWKVDVSWVDDGYDPGKAVAAAQSCKDSGAFMILGGIGFDQIPAVRQWAESNRQLYLHHIVTSAGSSGLRYSFTALPSEEQMGILAGNLAVQKLRGKKIGIIWRDSPNWQSGHDLFVKIVRDAGIEIVGDHKVTNGQGNYTAELATLKNTEKADAVFAWENALYTTDIIKTAQGQSYHPDWIVFPFNLELATLDKSSFDQKMYGVAAWDAYDPGYYDGNFSSYASVIKEFEQQYAAQKDSAGPNNKDGNDLLFLTWEGFRGLSDLLRACLPDCTRNRMAAAMLTYHKQLPGFCDIDFTRLDGHHGGFAGNYFEVFADPRDGHPAWRPSDRCVSV